MCFLILVNFGVMLTFLFSAIDLRVFFFFHKRHKLCIKKIKLLCHFSIFFQLWLCEKYFIYRNQSHEE